MSFGNARRHVAANRKVVQQRAMETMVARQNVQAQARRISMTPILVGAGGIVAALVALRRPARALSGVSSILLRLLSTPLGPMVIGALVAKLDREPDVEQAAAPHRQS